MPTQSCPSTQLLLNPTVPHAAGLSPICLAISSVLPPPPPAPTPSTTASNLLLSLPHPLSFPSHRSSVRPYSSVQAPSLSAPNRLLPGSSLFSHAHLAYSEHPVPPVAPPTLPTVLFPSTAAALGSSHPVYLPSRPLLASRLFPRPRPLAALAPPWPPTLSAGVKDEVAAQRYTETVARQGAQRELLPAAAATRWARPLRHARRGTLGGSESLTRAEARSLAPARAAPGAARPRL